MTDHDRYRALFNELAPDQAGLLTARDWQRISMALERGQPLAAITADIRGGKSDPVLVALQFLYSFLSVVREVMKLLDDARVEPDNERVPITVVQSLEDAPEEVRQRMKQIDLLRKLQEL